MARVVTGVNNSSIQDSLYSYDRYAVDDYWRRSEGRRSRYTEKFRECVESTYNTVRNSRLFRATLASVRRLKNAGRPDAVRQLINVGDIQNVAPTMQRLIMANPLLRRMVRNRQLEGYEGRWRDVNVNAIGDTDHTYRQIYDGLVVKEGERVFATSYAMTETDRRQFSQHELADVRITVHNIFKIIEQGDDDPLSVWNAALSKA